MNDEPDIKLRVEKKKSKSELEEERCQMPK